MSPLHFDEVAIELCDRLFPIKIDNSFARAQGLLKQYLRPIILVMIFLVTDVGDKKIVNKTLNCHRRHDFTKNSKLF